MCPGAFGDGVFMLSPAEVSLLKSEGLKFLLIHCQ